MRRSEGALLEMGQSAGADRARVLGVGVRRHRVGNIDVLRVAVRYKFFTDWTDVGLHGRVMRSGRIAHRSVH